MEESEEPVAAAVPPEAVDLGKIQRQVVRQDTVLDLGLGPGDRFMGLRQLLHVVDAGAQRIMVDLCCLDPEHVQHHLCILLCNASRVRASASDDTSRTSKPASARRHAIGR
ncbi:hypothetical protein A9K72_31415 [Mesorhizobium loti]|nr:hypothetical protein A9174_31470 [Mesorhizobium loti NZP2037]OBP79519.1 hypothetical protein BAE41_29400 [Mesorhizobium loti]OBP93777.1 hypothetical protein BAE38_30020 [Mesorhizobium loti]OBQ73206.1 hypothetical protein A9K72_31415 [Mesorhizobium loti]